ncbi:MAG: phage/plasmid primase, P4 family [Bacteroidales bacterium]|nr:phage/plasmid primase, P4 family [Bacteroidales bacterium]
MKVTPLKPLPEPPKKIKVDPVYVNFSFTDFGNAERLIAKTSGNIRYCVTNDSWYIWNGDGYWKKDSLGEIREYTKATLLSIHNEATYASDEKRKDMARKWAAQCEKMEHVSAAIKLASTDSRIVMPLEKFDIDIHLFNMLNGTYDLKNHMFLQHDRENRITRQVAFAYDKDAKCPNFLKFIERIFRSQKEKDNVIRYIQKAIGYTLTGEVSQQCIFLLYGSGSNGKSTLLETMRMLLGDYGTTIASASLTTQKNEGVRNDIARLPKIRFVVASENAKGTVIDEELIKKLTGGDEVTARFLFQEEFNFYPQLKLWWGFNHPPGLRDLTHSLMRRLKLIPFTETISDTEKIDQRVLLEMFRQELPGIFNWAIEGLKLFQREGLKDIETVAVAVREFKEEQDILYDWLNEKCYVVSRDATTPEALSQDVRTAASVLYNNYKIWAETRNEKVMSNTKFSIEMLERGFKREKTRTCNQFHGIGIK